ncbi:putative cysteine peptidase [Mycoplasma bradburyae]|uniref:putative cysteine peptidase n=1 Tax=Mycoplasma bradburyae TaxID=2963128 RepID=UPI0023423DA3|nr:hypothetical protein [Mycoplasma bradburyae]MDC4184035.1 hypothetical protein [Mycoplasma bradburyae]
MKSKITKIALAISTASLGVTALPSISTSSSNANEGFKNETELKEFLIDSEVGRLIRISNNYQSLKVVKEIKDIKGNEYILIGTDNLFSIVDTNLYISNEIHQEKINDEWLKYDLYYSKSFGLLKRINENKFLSLYSNNEISKDDLSLADQPLEIDNISEFKEKQLAKRDKEIKYKWFRSREANIIFDKNNTPYNYDGRFSVSHTVPYAWWFATRNDIESAGCMDLSDVGVPPSKKIGLCEYIALSQILLYNHLFVDGSIFTDYEYNKYIKDANEWTKEHWEDTSPVFRNLYKGAQYTDSLTYKLYKSGGEKLDLKTTIIYGKMFDSFNLKERNSWVGYGSIAGYYKAWQSVRRGIPVILGAAPIRLPNNPNNWFDHAYLMYGYDDSSDMFLGSMCWGQFNSNRFLYSYYNNCWGSYYYTIESTKQKKDRKQPKAFKYKNNWYTGNEINNFIMNGEKF